MMRICFTQQRAELLGAQPSPEWEAGTSKEAVVRRTEVSLSRMKAHVCKWIPALWQSGPQPKGRGIPAWFCLRL